MNKKILMPLFVLSLIAGCASKNEQAAPQVERSISVTSAAMQGFSLSPGTRIAWTKASLIYDKSQEKVTPYVSFIQSTIENDLRTRGFVVERNPALADYLIGGALVVANSEFKQRVNQAYQLYPDIGPAQQNRDTAELVLTLSKGEVISTDYLQWRAGAVVFVIGELTEQQRMQRIQQIIKQILNTLP